MSRLVTGAHIAAMPRTSSGRSPANNTPAARVVSLVPSETESVALLAGLGRLVGRTDFCIEPLGIEAIPSVGGTKRFDVEAVLALAPDLILANQEENGEKDVRALIAAGAPVHLSFPCTMEGSRDYVSDLCALLGVDRTDAVGEAERAIADAGPPAWKRGAPSVAVPIWREPWMSFDERTFASAIVEAAGGRNAFSGRPRRYPLAADLSADVASVRTDKDTRYPRFSLDELIDRAPDVVLLPDEPYAFGAEHRAELVTALGHDRVVLTDGKDLFWYGVRAAGAARRLRALLASLDPDR